MHRNVLVSIICLVIAGLSCSMPVTRSDYCLSPPEHITASDMVGTWTARYENHHIFDFEWEGQKVITGVETINLLADGTYLHTFENASYHYASEPASWSFNADAMDAPKLKMSGMRFFGAGETFDEKTQTLQLVPELGDIIFTYQEANIRYEPVEYPDSGFVYLYVRKCRFWSKVSLQQMMFVFRDPDNTKPASPMFYKE